MVDIEFYHLNMEEVIIWELCQEKEDLDLVMLPPPLPPLQEVLLLLLVQPPLLLVLLLLVLLPLLLVPPLPLQAQLPLLPQDLHSCLANKLNPKLLTPIPFLTMYLNSPRNYSDV